MRRKQYIYYIIITKKRLKKGGPNCQGSVTVLVYAQFYKENFKAVFGNIRMGSTLAQYSWLCLLKIHCHLVLTWSAGQCFMGSTNAQDQEQALLGECLGQENSRTRKLSLLFPLAISMALNGSDCDHFMNKIMFNFVYQ